MGMNGEAQPLLGSSRDERGKKFNQYLAAISGREESYFLVVWCANLRFLANIIGLSFGNVIGEYLTSQKCLKVNSILSNAGWSSPAIAKFQEHTADSPLDFIPTTEQLSWIGSLLSIGGFFGILFAPLPEWIGRKWSLLVNALLFISSFLILIYTQNITAIYIARFIQGFAAGVCNSVLPMYVGEIASPDCRWKLKIWFRLFRLLNDFLEEFCQVSFKLESFVSKWIIFLKFDNSFYGFSWNSLHLLRRAIRQLRSVSVALSFYSYDFYRDLHLSSWHAVLLCCKRQTRRSHKIFGIFASILQRKSYGWIGRNWNFDRTIIAK